MDCADVGPALGAGAGAAGASDATSAKLSPPPPVAYKCAAALLGHTKGVAAARFSPDGRFVATACA